MRTAVLVIVAFGPLGAVPAADDNKDLIVGQWELAFSDAKDVPAGTRLEFTKDGKAKMTVKADGKDVTVEDTYAVEKDVLTLGDPKRNGPRGDAGRICLLNKTTLVLHDEREDKVLVLKRLKAR